MKPNDFMQNTDYLALSQIGRSSEFLANFSARQYPSSGYNFFDADDSLDFSFPTVTGAIDQFRIKVGNEDWIVGNSINQIAEMDLSTFELLNGGYTLVVYRLNANTIRVRLFRYAPTGSFPSIPTAPALSFRIVGVAFRPPNAF